MSCSGVMIDTHPLLGAVVFQLHYNELLAKDEEITKLRAVIQGLSGR